MSVAVLSRRLAKVEEQMPELMEPGLHHEIAQKLSELLDQVVGARERIERYGGESDPFRGVDSKWDPPKFLPGGNGHTVVLFYLHYGRRSCFFDRLAAKLGVDIAELMAYVEPHAQRHFAGFGWRCVQWLRKYGEAPPGEIERGSPGFIWRNYCHGRYLLEVDKGDEVDEARLVAELNEEEPIFLAAAAAAGWVELGSGKSAEEGEEPDK